jgi:hypothetical protein
MLRQVFIVTQQTSTNWCTAARRYRCHARCDTRCDARCDTRCEARCDTRSDGSCDTRCDARCDAGSPVPAGQQRSEHRRPRHCSCIWPHCRKAASPSAWPTAVCTAAAAGCFVAAALLHGLHVLAAAAAFVRVPSNCASSSCCHHLISCACHPYTERHHTV